MSGFGGSGFGGSPFGASGPGQPQQPFTFGSSSTNQPPSSSSSSFGAFGGSSGVIGTGGGGMLSFGTSPNVSSAAGTPASTFGNSTSTGGFPGGGFSGTNPSIFGAAPAPARVSSSFTFGTSGFGNSSTVMSGSSSSFPSSTATNPSGATPFGSSPFAPAATTSSPFVIPFGGGGGTTQQQTFSSNPFIGGTPIGAASAAPVAFGVSSNVIPSSTSFTPFGAAATSTSGFGSASSTSFTGGFSNNNSFFNSTQAGDDSDMMGTSSPIPVFGGGTVSPNNFQMASPVMEDSMEDAADPGSINQGFGAFAAPSFITSANSTTTTSGTTWPPMVPAAAPASTMTFGTSRNTHTSSLSPVLEEDGNDQDDENTIVHAAPLGRGGASAPAAPSAEDETTSEDQKRLEMLKAKLAEKKRKLLEKQQLAARGSGGGGGGGNTTPPPGSSPPRFRAGTSSHPPQTQQSSRSATPTGLAQRNAVRFATTDATANSTAFPKSHSSSNHEYSSTQVAPTEREDLSAAVSLVGTCPYMCPDEELARRQREGDIQLLELPHPAIYPGGSFTLRDTAVKRFRRSAADYKLDIPELVRPPDVLERVCSYLEEWVMERDRQGADPRFPQNGTPPSLDVYQFIWDRTRMIRKDFILQNYVGTGGKCDARAVRCHERIARWHAMCEHQLSHIPEFVKAQSQQNIQELGQAMKTLNQYYDDAQRRSLLEVADNDGNETRLDLDGYDHGCVFDFVQGKNPVDYDGTVLDNKPTSTAIAKRLVGKHAVKSPNHGTAEPEMRGLYILLTIDNDGGMEVLKYAAHLYQRHPAMYHSKPVQLALSICKAKKEYNYARFFALLRSPETPYLFACIMFKHVELMRKMAFRIMSKTYGGRSKDKNEPIYDQFPLKNLANLLCFETLDEARVACNHYNITVKTMKIRTSSGATASEEIVHWRHSTFNEPKDEDKGTLIPLPPQKMLRIIEGKLKGATRLAVCRGQVSGDGAFLALGGSGEGNAHPVATVPNEVSRVSVATRSDDGDDVPDDEDDFNYRSNISESEAARQEAKFEELKRLQLELLRKQGEEDAKREREEKARLHQEEERQRERDRVKQEYERREQARKAREEQERLQRIQKEEEAERKRIKLEQEAAQRKAKLEQEAAQRKAEEAERQRQLEIEMIEAKRKRDQEAQECRQKEEARLRWIEEERKRLEREKAEQRMRLEEEARQREALQRDLEIKRIREQEERWLEKEWITKTNAACKKLIWGMLQRNYPRRLSIQHSSNETIRCLDATARVSPASGVVLGTRLEPVQEVSTSPDLRRVVDKLLKQDVHTNLARLVMDVLSVEMPRLVSCHRKKTTLLLTAAVYIPYSRDVHRQTLYELILMWISSRLGLDQISSASGRFGEVRVAIVDGTNINENKQLPADAALVVLPPPCSDAEKSSTDEDVIQSITERVDSSVPTVILSLCQHSSVSSSSASSRPSASDSTTDPALKLAAFFHKSKVVTHDSVAEDVLEASLQSASSVLASAMVDSQSTILPTCLVVDRFSVMQLGLKALRGTILRDGSVGKLATGVLEHARISLGCLVDVLHGFSVDGCEEIPMDWPSGVFSLDGSVVPDYFGKGVHLPLDWRTSLRFEYVEPEIVDLCNILAGSLEEVIDYLLFDAPPSVKEESRQLSDRRCYRECFYHAICYREQNIELEDNEPCVYLPRHLVGKLIGRAVQRFLGLVEAERPRILAKPKSSRRWQAEASYNPFATAATSSSTTTTPMMDFAESIDLPPAASPFPPSEDVCANNKRLRHHVVDESPAMSVDPKDDGGQNAKRSRRSDDESKRAIGAIGASTSASSTNNGNKNKKKTTRKTAVSQNLKESKAFTRRLKELAKGGTHDMMVGSMPLSVLLQSAPDITLVSDSS